MSRARVLNGKSIRGLAVLLAAGAISLFTAAAAVAAGPKWRVEGFSDAVAAPGGFHQLSVEVVNRSADLTDGSPFQLDIDLPAGMKGVEILRSVGGMECPADVTDATDIQCTSEAEAGPLQMMVILVKVAVAADAEGSLTARYKVSGGGAAAPGFAADSVEASSTPPSFGFEAFDTPVRDETGGLSSQAGGHPFDFTTAVEFKTTGTPPNKIVQPAGAPSWPVEQIKTVELDLPPGFVGNPTTAATCPLGDLALTNQIFVESTCTPDSQVGTAALAFGIARFAPSGVYNLEPPPGVPARFGVNFFGTVVIFDATLRNGGDYGLTIVSKNTSEGLTIPFFDVTMWGVPSAPEHEFERACPGTPLFFGGPTCPGDASGSTFLRNPTSCPSPGTGIPSTMRVDSWDNPGKFVERTVYSHEPLYYPSAEDEWGPAHGTDGCAAVPFNPGLSVEPTTTAADSPSGLTVDLSIPQGCWTEEDAICESDLKDAVVTLPRGMSLNPSSADGLAACSKGQIGLLGTNFPAPNPIHFTADAAQCPAASKIGAVEVDTPLLDKPLHGGIYLAEQGSNPFGSLVALYATAEGPGVNVKLAGKVEMKPDGQVVTRFENNPQTPFSRFRFALFGGPRAALRTPPSCGTHTASAALTPWSGNATVTEQSSFQITSGPGGVCPTGSFSPRFSAGSRDPLAAAFTPFNLRIARDDGTVELAGVEATLPKGLLGKLAGIPYCSDAALGSVSGVEGTGTSQIASPSCPASSQVGTVVVGAGAGSNPFFARTGKAYLAGPYKGAPLSLAVVAPAVAGPFDLGSVLVRNALRINSETTEITAVSDSFPTVLHGIPLDLRDVRVNVDRPGFTLNPTSCDPMSVEATISGVGGVTAKRSQRFQVGACANLRFKPELSLRLKGGTERGDHPALNAVLTMPRGGANIARASVALPRSEFLDNAHIGTICTRVQFAAKRCPARSVYGFARAFSPLLDKPLEGPVYLRSSNHELPDLVAALRGQIEIDVVGRIDQVNRGIRTTFETVPDAPVSKFVLKMQGGKKGLLQNSRDICANTFHATAQFDGQNGKVSDSTPKLVASCGKSRRGKGGKGR